MQRTLISFILILFLSAKVFSATSVYFFNGKVEVIDKNKNTTPLSEVGIVLSDDASLKLIDNAEVILRNDAKEFAVIHGTGTYTSAQIKEQFVKQQGKGLVTSLAGFMGSQFSNKKEDVRAMAEKYMKQKGGVTRSGNTYPIMYTPTYGSVTDIKEVKFIWRNMPNVKQYEFVLFGGNDPNNLVQMSKTLTTDTFMDVAFTDFGVTEDAYFSWVAYPEGDPNYSRYTFKISTPESIKKVIGEIEILAAKETSKEDKLLLRALAYERKGLVAYAETAYTALLAISNKNTYKELYTMFQMRNGLVD
jgi:hypothetical protein